MESCFFLLKIAPKKNADSPAEAAFLCCHCRTGSQYGGNRGLALPAAWHIRINRGTTKICCNRQKEDNGNDGFYRVEDSGRKTKNDDSLYGYRSATIFSSLMNLDVSHLFQSLYMEGGKKFLLLQWCFPASVSHVFGEVYAFL